MEALVDQKRISVEHIVLPRLSSDSSTGLDAFLPRVSRMRRVRTVDFVCLFPNVMGSDDYENVEQLLLKVVQENKYLRSFGKALKKLDHDYPHCPLLPKIKYYIKLNQFGGHLLEGPNVPCLWPTILVGLRKVTWPVLSESYLTSKPDDSSALYFFLREYFLRNSYPLRLPGRQDPQQPQGGKQGPQSRKRAKLDEDSQNHTKK